MNLGLSRYKCTKFTVWAEFPISAESDEEIRGLMTKTHHRTHDDGSPQEAVFLSRFTVGETQEESAGILFRELDDDGIKGRVHIMNRPLKGGPRRYPRQFKPVRLLLDSTVGLFGKLRVQCHTGFEYPISDGVSPKIVFPISIMLPDDNGITHMEGAEFSRRTSDGIEYSVFITSSEEDGTLSHFVHFDTEIEVNRNSIRGLRDKCRSISNRLLVQKGG